ncbi:MAG: hypothetical protein JWO11_2052 [Nocardioides sp.]|nr:hypothetical protein [Nocardioides sp.]
MITDRREPRTLPQVPIWMGTVAVVAAVLAGFLLGRSTTGDPEEAGTQTGVVDSIDTEQGTICLSSGGSTVECYRAPGVGLRAGDQVQYRTELEWIDAEHHAKQNVIVYVLRQ